MAEAARGHPAPAFVVTSDLEVAVEGSTALEAAFCSRLGEVEGHPGFQRLEVWRDSRRPGAYQMVSWWDDEASFLAYMRSAAHRRSHARIPTEPARPRGVRLRRFDVVAD
jgi:heme-degrading monooxygenase HmoA